MARPAVTVLLPTYNRAPLLREAIASVLAQTRTDFILLVSDNASTDETPATVASFDDERIVSVRRPVNLGMCGNFNAALAQVTTPYAAILLDDDLWESTFLERTLALLDAEPGVGLVHTAFRVIDRAGRVLVASMDWHEGGGRTGVRPGRELIADLLGQDSPVMASSTVLRTRAVPSQGWDERDVQAEDMGLLLRLALDWHVAFIAEPLAAFRMHPGSLSVAAGEVIGPGTFPGFRQISQRQKAKERFLDEQADRLHEIAYWRARIATKARTDALGTVWARTHRSRRPRETFGALRQAHAEVPGLPLDLRAWRLLMLSVGFALVRGVSPPKPARGPRRRPTSR